MGGGDHHHHHKPYIVPDASIYKLENAPELVRVQEKLAKDGLRDPWLRNEVWRYEKKHWGTFASRAAIYFLRGAKLGIPAFLITIAAEKALGIDYGHGHGHGHDAEHGDHH